MLIPHERQDERYFPPKAAQYRRLFAFPKHLSIPPKAKRGILETAY